MALTPRFTDAPAMLLAGIRRHHRMSEVARTIPAQWEEFRTMGLRDTRAPRAFGAICGTRGDEIEYMTAIEVDSFDDLPEGIGRMRVPAQHYAVFEHRGHISAVGPLWQAIMEDWLPASGYVDVETPAFELYDQRYDPETGAGGFEIWIPVARRPAV